MFKEMVEERKEEQGKKMGWTHRLEGLGVKTCSKLEASGPTLILARWLWQSNKVVAPFTGQESKHYQMQRYYNNWKLTVSRLGLRKSQPVEEQPSPTESGKWSRRVKWCSMCWCLPKPRRTIWDRFPRKMILKLGQQEVHWAEGRGLLLGLWIRCQS